MTAFVKKSTLIAASLMVTSAIASAQLNKISVCFNKTAMLIFPQVIRDADYGSSDILVRQPKRTTNVLKVKAARDGFEPTNLSVITTDGKLYSINVLYDPDPAQTAYSNFLESATVPEVAFREGMSPAEVEFFARQIASSPARKHRPVMTDNQMGMRLSNIFINDGLLFFAFELENRSQVPFDVYFTRYYLRDLSRTKRTSSMEKEIAPRFVYFNTDSTILKGTPTMMVVAFDKFTIADKKHFDCEVYETNGDRLLKLRIRGKHILAAQPFVPRHAGN